MFSNKFNMLIISCYILLFVLNLLPINFIGWIRVQKYFWCFHGSSIVQYSIDLFHSCFNHPVSLGASLRHLVDHCENRMLDQRGFWSYPARLLPGMLGGKDQITSWTHPVSALWLATKSQNGQGSRGRWLVTLLQQLVHTFQLQSSNLIQYK